MKMHKMKFVAVVDGDIVIDGTRWYPRGDDKHGQNPHKVLVTNHGILYTKLCDLLSTYVTLVSNGRKRCKDYYSEWEELELYDDDDLVIYTEDEFVNEYGYSPYKN